MSSTTASTQPPLHNMLVLTLRSACSPISCWLGLGLLISCHAPLPPTEYTAYLADPTHGLTHTIQTNSATVTCTYRPTALLVQQDLANARNPNATTRDSLVRAYAGKTYCTLTLARHGAEIENQFINYPTTYQQALTYLNTGIAVDAFLVTTPRDSVAAMASMYMRQYGTTGHSTLLLVFDTHQFTPQKGFSLALYPKQLGLGPLRFQFTGSDLAALPELRLN